jgi:hypothetical protein
VKVAIIGTGRMGHAIGSRMLGGGHAVDFVGTHISKARELADELIGEGEVDAAETIDADVVVLAVPYTEAPHVVREWTDQLGGAVVVDPTNPIDFGTVEMLDSAWIAPFASGGQLIAAEVPEGATFVKAFNTNFAGPLLAGQVRGQPLDVYVAGDDDASKAKVIQLVADAGLRGIDAGPLRRARELEATALLHISMQSSVGGEFATALKVLTPL